MVDTEMEKKACDKCGATGVDLRSSQLCSILMNDTNTSGQAAPPWAPGGGGAEAGNIYDDDTLQAHEIGLCPRCARSAKRLIGIPAVGFIAMTVVYLVISFLPPLQPYKLFILPSVFVLTCGLVVYWWFKGRFSEEIAIELVEQKRNLELEEAGLPPSHIEVKKLSSTSRHAIRARTLPRS
jgi:hypothetical protein